MLPPTAALTAVAAAAASSIPGAAVGAVVVS